jgi:hypothetical protein
MEDALRMHKARDAPLSKIKAKKGLLSSQKRSVFARLLDSLSIPWHGKSSGELGSVMI